MLPDLPVLAHLPASVEAVLPRERAFGGFTAETFDVLGALRREPNVEAYRREKDGIDAHVVAPFKRYRDDLVVSLVLPNRLPLETERNVFSRLLKNDYGAGGCHAHLWMSFYRTGRKRLTDPQMSHSVDADGVSVGLYVGDHYGDYFARFKARLAAEPQDFAALLARTLAPSPQRPPFSAHHYTRAKGQEVTHTLGGAAPDLTAPDLTAVDLAAVARATGVWVRTRWPREVVVAMGPAFLDAALRAVTALWPLYVWQCDAADR